LNIAGGERDVGHIGSITLLGSLEIEVTLQFENIGDTRVRLRKSSLEDVAQIAAIRVRGSSRTNEVNKHMHNMISNARGG